MFEEHLLLGVVKIALFLGAILIFSHKDFTKSESISKATTIHKALRVNIDLDLEFGRRAKLCSPDGHITGKIRAWLGLNR